MQTADRVGLIVGNLRQQSVLNIGFVGAFDSGMKPAQFGRCIDGVRF
jgi:hypothetical protein